jgi:hypothetical protein
LLNGLGVKALASIVGIAIDARHTTVQTTDDVTGIIMRAPVAGMTVGGAVAASAESGA